MIDQDYLRRNANTEAVMSRRQNVQRPPARSIAIAGMLVVAALLVTVCASGAQADPLGVEAVDPWATGWCYQSQQCAVGDFNGDHKTDTLVFYHSYSSDLKGHVEVRLSNGASFGAAQTWHTQFCVGSSEVCKVGDFNGDGLDDIVAFVRGTSSPNVWVALSTGYGFGEASIWNDFFCYGNEICDVGDFNGDGWDDIVTFIRSTNTSKKGQVRVAINTYNGQFESDNDPWNEGWFCISQEICGTGDFNADGKDDVIAFEHGTSSGNVWVALSTGSSFVKINDNAPWKQYFCGISKYTYLQEVCGVGDFNGDGRDDIVTYLRSTWSGKIGEVDVALSQGAQFQASATTWNSFFCIGNEICGTGNYVDGVSNYSQVSRTGDYNGDGREDAITFLRSTDSTKAGYVYVLPSTGSSFGYLNLPFHLYLPLALK